jgi:TetR/AcrR family tetracycline transcriptional repressor
MTTTRGRGQRAGLDHQAVLAAARAVIAGHGLRALTIRSIAAELGVAPNALYNQTAGKEQLVDHLLDSLLEHVGAPAGAEPLDALRALLASTYDALVAHPDLAPLFLARRRRTGRNATRLSMEVFTALARVGVAPADQDTALRVLVVHTFGFATVAGRPAFTAGGEEALSPARLRGEFLRGLDWILTGLRQTAAGPTAAD